MSTSEWILRGVLAVNFALLVLSFVPAFSGIGQPEPGVADRLWGNYRFDGWRADVVWMCVSTVICLLRVYLVIVVRGPTWTRERGSRRITSILCWVWLACFFFLYLPYTLMHMFG
ncbi:MAG TPA: hypothetical protein VJO33_17720 [Gemmatimonadaceae bacterium]|nr:hypothetical protein [Gemmatimonadaceae bacterium]